MVKEILRWFGFVSMSNGSHLTFLEAKHQLDEEATRGAAVAFCFHCVSKTRDVVADTNRLAVPHSAGTKKDRQFAAARSQLASDIHEIERGRAHIAALKQYLTTTMFK